MGAPGSQEILDSPLMITTIEKENTDLQTVNKNNSMKFVCGFEETSYQKIQRTNLT